jgi:hypothetical protein
MPKMNLFASKTNSDRQFMQAQQLPTININQQGGYNTNYSNFSIFLDPNIKQMQRSDIFKTSIYSKLIPVNSDSHIEHKSRSVIKKEKEEEVKTLYGPYLNFDYEEYNKKIKIKNPKIKKNLEDIDYYGPYFSHCPSCKNKNLDFYQTMESNQCLKLLSYLKKVRIKSSHKNSKSKKHKVVQ